MRSFLLTLSIVAVAVPAMSGDRRPGAAVSATEAQEIAIAFTGAASGSGEAMLDAGTMSQAASHMRRRSAFQRQVIGIRLDARDAAPGQTATLLASLETWDGRCAIRIDGTPLATVPKVIDAQAPLGVAALHTIEIEIPADVPEGSFATSIHWEVVTH